MNTKGLLFALFLIVNMLLATSSGNVVAQSDVIGKVTTADDRVYRAFDSASIFGVDTNWGTAYYLEFIGDKFKDEEEASNNFAFMVTYLPTALPTVLEELVNENLPGATVLADDPVSGPVLRIGDEAFSISIRLDKGILIDEFFGMLVIRQGARVLTATVASNDVNLDYVSLLSSMLDPIMQRWDDENAVKLDSEGIRMGGIWDMVPRQNEVPQGFELDVDYEEGPGLSEEAESSSVTNKGEPAVRGGSHTGNQQSDRIAKPFDVEFRIIMFPGTYESSPDGTCAGIGGYSGLAGGRSVSLKSPNEATILAISAPLNVGILSYDMEAGEEVCVFETSFHDVPPRGNYILSSYWVDFSEFSFPELSSEDVIEIIVAE